MCMEMAVPFLGKSIIEKLLAANQWNQELQMNEYDDCPSLIIFAT
ncbi:hypothetical protein Pint_02916 [Pistacia integerrima]|uniref:Uncharacterized protein n=1 Tax=Pistacia integerrima TaxID=434235 RepID=A0ACC0ZH34_9ROSI|nr:hypothetical protein Pint_02916 [Pistacia integerrima]